MASDRGYYRIEGRWEHSHNAPGEDAFFLIDEIGGSLDDAKRVAQSYYDKHIAQNYHELEWVAGITRKKQCYYANSPNITFRVAS